MDSAATTTAAGILITTKPALAARSPLQTTNLGALTTTFTPPDDCTSLTVRYHISNKPETYYFNYGFTCNGDETNDIIYGRPMAKPTCFPQSFASAFTCEFELSDMVTPYPVYSPGLVCPHGYGPSCTISLPPDTAPSDAANTTSSWNRAERSIQRMLKAGETAIGCCPSGYVCDVSKPHGCVSTVKLGGQISAVNGARGVCFRSTAFRTMTATSDTRAVAWGPRVLVVQSTATQGSDEGSHDTGSGFSPVKQAVMAVCLPLGLTVFALAAYILIHWRRKRAKDRARAASTCLDGDRGDIPELEGKSVIIQVNDLMDQSDESHELPGDHRYLAQELEGTVTPAELDTGGNI